MVKDVCAFGRGRFRSRVRWTYRFPRPTTIEPLLFQRIANYEGLPHPPGKAYKDIYGNVTVGRGHRMRSEDERLFRHLFGTALSAHRVRCGQQTLSMDQVETLFDYDVETRVHGLRSQLPLWNAYLPNTRVALLQSAFRGDLGPRTTNHVLHHQFLEASKEILRTPEKDDVRIRGRLEDASRALLQEDLDGYASSCTSLRDFRPAFSIHARSGPNARGFTTPRHVRSCVRILTYERDPDRYKRPSARPQRITLAPPNARSGLRLSSFRSRYSPKAQEPIWTIWNVAV